VETAADFHSLPLVARNRRFIAAEDVQEGGIAAIAGWRAASAAATSAALAANDMSSSGSACFLTLVASA